MQTEKIRRKRNQESNRLTLTDKAHERAKGWLSQIEEEFSGMLLLKRNDLINTVLEELDEMLSTTLLEKIKNEKLTDKEKAKWIYHKFLEAEKEGHNADLGELIKTAQGSSKTRRKARKTPVKKVKTPASESAVISPNISEKTPNSI